LSNSSTYVYVHISAKQVKFEINNLSDDDDDESSIVDNNYQREKEEEKQQIDWFIFYTNRLRLIQTYISVRTNRTIDIVLSFLSLSLSLCIFLFEYCFIDSLE